MPSVSGTEKNFKETERIAKAQVCKSRFKRHTSQVPNLMQRVRVIVCLICVTLST